MSRSGAGACVTVPEQARQANFGRRVTITRYCAGPQQIHDWRRLARNGSGLVLYWKRLENGAFKWPPVTGGVMRMNAAQLAALLSGMDWTRMHAPRIARPKEIV